MTNGELKLFTSIANGRPLQAIEAYAIVTISHLTIADHELIVSSNMPHNTLGLRAMLKLALEAEGANNAQILQAATTFRYCPDSDRSANLCNDWKSWL